MGKGTNNGRSTDMNGQMFAQNYLLVESGGHCFSLATVQEFVGYILKY